MEDQRAFADALGLALSMTPDLVVVGKAPDAESGAELVAATHPDLLVADYRLAGSETGLDLARRLREVDSKLPVVILTGYPAPQVVREATALGSVVVLSKNSPIVELVSAFRIILAGGKVASAEIDDPFDLSVAELEVLELLSQGLNATQIAAKLFLSIHAIRARIKSTLRKLDVSSQLEAVAKAASLQLLVPPRQRRVEPGDT